MEMKTSLKTIPEFEEGIDKWMGTDGASLEGLK